MKRPAESTRIRETGAKGNLFDAYLWLLQKLASTLLPNVADQFRVGQASTRKVTLKGPRADVELCRHSLERRMTFWQQASDCEPHFIHGRTNSCSSEHSNNSMYPHFRK